MPLRVLHPQTVRQLAPKVPQIGQPAVVGVAPPREGGPPGSGGAAENGRPARDEDTQRGFVRHGSSKRMLSLAVPFSHPGSAHAHGPTAARDFQREVRIIGPLQAWDRAHNPVAAWHALGKAGRNEAAPGPPRPMPRYWNQRQQQCQH